MFVKRNPGRKGPSNRQVYVPRDQRELNPSPIPIRTLKEADFYYQQLQGMGLINPVVDNYKPQVIQIKRIEDDSFVTFRIGSESDKYTPKDLNDIRSDVCNAYDVQGNLLDKTKYDLTNILDQNGYKLYPIVMDIHITVYNSRNDASVLLAGYYLSGGTPSSITIPSLTNYKIYENSPTFTTAFPNREGDQLILYSYSNIYESTTPIFFKCPAQYCYLRCYNLTCIVVKTE